MHKYNKNIVLFKSFTAFFEEKYQLNLTIKNFNEMGCLGSIICKKRGAHFNAVRFYKNFVQLAFNPASCCNFKDVVNIVNGDG